MATLEKRVRALESVRPEKPPAESRERQLLGDALPYLTEDELDELEALLDSRDGWIEGMPEAAQKRYEDMLTGAIARGQRHGIGFKVE